MSRAMTNEEFVQLLCHIKQEHSPFSMRLRLNEPVPFSVKYVDPVFDMRDGRCFSIKFRGLGRTLQLHTCNEQRDYPDSLFDRCMAALDNPDDFKEYHVDPS